MPSCPVFLRSSCSPFDVHLRVLRVFVVIQVKQLLLALNGLRTFPPSRRPTSTTFLTPQHLLLLVRCRLGSGAEGARGQQPLANALVSALLPTGLVQAQAQAVVTRNRSPWLSPSPKLTASLGTSTAWIGCLVWIARTALPGCKWSGLVSCFLRSVDLSVVTAARATTRSRATTTG